MRGVTPSGVINIVRIMKTLRAAGWKLHVPEPFGDGWMIEENAKAIVVFPEGREEDVTAQLPRIEAGELPRFLPGTDLRFFNRRIIVSAGPTGPESNDEWIHASISTQSQLPTYADLVLLHKAVWGDDGWSYQCFAPVSAHVNIHEFTLHLWGRPDGRAALPNFGVFGTI